MQTLEQAIERCGSKMGNKGFEAAQVAVVQATMPTAITTFALAEAYGIGRAAMVRTIVGSTVLFMISFAVLAPALLRLL